jgi:hypothetical protein
MITPRLEMEHIIYRHRGTNWTIAIWPDKGVQGWWYWQVGPQDGKEPSKESAEIAARKWIRGR